MKVSYSSHDNASKECQSEKENEMTKEPHLIQEHFGWEMIAYPKGKIGGVIVYCVSNNHTLRIHVGDAFCMCHDAELVVPQKGEGYVSVPVHSGGQVDWYRVPITPAHFAKARARCKKFGVETPKGI